MLVHLSKLLSFNTFPLNTTVIGQVEYKTSLAHVLSDVIS